MFVVGDIGGEYDALVALTRGVKDKIVLVGDLNDRGPKSREVIEWAIKNDGHVVTLHSNHGDMMVDFYDGIKMYDYGDFLRNGGYNTLVSYGYPVPRGPYLDPSECSRWAKAHIPASHIEFLRSRPTFYEEADAVVSHAPAPHPRYFSEQLGSENIFNWIWNRNSVVPHPQGKWQIFGHNSAWGYQVNHEEKWVCLDDSRQDKLTGIAWPSMQVRQKIFRLRPSRSEDSGAIT